MIHNTEYRESKGPGSAPKRPRSVLESPAALVPKQTPDADQGLV